MQVAGSAKNVISLTQSTAELIGRVRTHLKHELKGMDVTVDHAMAVFLAGGHLLLEGPPGIGKTSLAKALASAFGGSFKRIQMTSDLLPSDIVGILRPSKDGSLEFRRGPIFSNVLLTDELNRTSPKTQSALLEAMAESTVTVDGKTYALPSPFFVVATQNPLEFQGVYPLTESELDRFMLQLSITHPDHGDELAIYQRALAPQAAGQSSCLTVEETFFLRNEVGSVHVEATVLEYVHALVRSTRTHSELAYGVSVRGGLQLLAASRALAMVRGRMFVTPKDIQDLAVPCLAHRLSFPQGEADQTRRAAVIESCVALIKPPA